jgi:hypothetical protein
MARMHDDVGGMRPNVSHLPQQPLLLLLLLLELLPITTATVWLECASSMCVECHQSSPTPINVYRWYSTGWFDCQTGSALSYTDYCRQQPQPFNATPPFSSIFSSEKEMSFGSDGGNPDDPFLVKIPFKPTSPMATASLNTTTAQSATTLRYSAPALVHDIIPIKLALPMCVQPFPPPSSFSSGSIGLSAPAGRYGLWLYIVDKRGLTLAAAIANATVPRRSSLQGMARASAEHAFSAASGCKYVYAVLYVAASSSAEAIELSFDWLPQTLSDHGGVVSFDYLSADKFEFDPARVEGKYGSVRPLCQPERCDGSDVLFDVVIDGLGGATLSLVLVPIGDVTSPNGTRMTPVSGQGYRVGNVLEFETSLFGGGSANLMVTVTGIEQVRQQLPLRLLSDFGSVLESGVAKTDVWCEFLSAEHNSSSVGAQAAGFTVVSPPSSFHAVSPRVAASQCSSHLSAQTFTTLANKPAGPSMSNSQFNSCRRVCGSLNAATGPASISSSGGARCGVPVFTAGDTASITCAEGHWLSSGTQQRACQADYSFSSSAVCSPLSCPTLAPPSSGSLLPTPFWQARFSCNTHWRLSGSALLTCLSLGQWDLPAPTCIRVTCPPLSPPQYGRVLVQPLLNYSYGSTVEYTVAHLQSFPATPSGSLLSVSCDLGFYLTGDRFATCEASGAYNATLGSCVPVPCNSFATLKLPPRAIAIPASIRYLDTAVVTCESGYRFENGSAEIAASCDMFGNVSLAASVPLCLRIPNFCEVRLSSLACAKAFGTP